MKIDPRDAVAAYKALAIQIENSNSYANEALLLFFLQRMAVFCAEADLVAAEQHSKNLADILAMIENMDVGIAEALANVAKDNAENSGSSGQEQVDVGYYSVLSYSFVYLLNRQTDYVNYASDSYLGAVESYLFDRDEVALDNEILNIERLIEAVVSLDKNRIVNGLAVLAAWAAQASVGQILPDFEA